MGIKDWFGKKRVKESPEENSEAYQASGSSSSLPVDHLDTSDPERCLTGIGLTILRLYSEDMRERADAVKALASVLDSPDTRIVNKAATGLSEGGPIGVRYMELALGNPDLNDAARVILQVRVKMLQADPPFRFDLSRDNLQEKVNNILSDASMEAGYHGFSGIYAGILEDSEPRLKFAFDINNNRGEELQAIVSFSPFDSEKKCGDEDCIPVVELFAQNNPYSENAELNRMSSIPGIRYFAFQVG